MKLDCSFLDTIRSDFSALWKCKQHEGAVEIATPYLYPRSKFVRVFLTQREDRYIVTEDGDIGESLREWLPGEEFSSTLDEMARDSGIKRGTHDGEAIYFKECTDPKLITSLILDVASFASKSAAAMLSLGGERSDDTEKDVRFVTEARSFLQEVKRPDQTMTANYYLDDVPIRFSAGLVSASKIWLVSSISGSSPNDFVKNMSYTALNIKDVRKSRYSQRITATIPIINNTAPGYDRDDKIIQMRMVDLEENAGIRPVLWTERDRLRPLLDAA